MKKVFLGIDIGGSHISTGYLSADNGDLLSYHSSPVEHSTFDELVESICDVVITMMEKELIQNHREFIVQCIGVGCPGQCKDGRVIGACIFCKSLVMFVRVKIERMKKYSVVEYIFYFL